MASLAHRTSVTCDGSSTSDGLASSCSLLTSTRPVRGQHNWGVSGTATEHWAEAHLETSAPSSLACAAVSHQSPIGNTRLPIVLFSGSPLLSDKQPPPSPLPAGGRRHGTAPRRHGSTAAPRRGEGRGHGTAAGPGPGRGAPAWGPARPGRRRGARPAGCSGAGTAAAPCRRGGGAGGGGAAGGGGGWSGGGEASGRKAGAPGVRRPGVGGRPGRVRTHTPAALITLPVPQHK